MNRCVARLLPVACAVLSMVGVNRATAVLHLKPGSKPPAIALPDLRGEEVRTASFEGQTMVLVFGELYHDKTLEACAEIQAALADQRLAKRTITPLLIVGQNAPPETLAARAAEVGVSWRILHDHNRDAFGAYRVAVLPSVVVLDTDGRVVHALAGSLGRLADIVSDAMLVSEQLLSPEQFQQTLLPSLASPTSRELSRAARLTNLGRQLFRRGLPDLAEEKYREALELSPEYGPARIGLGLLQLRRGRLAEAEQQFRTALASEPRSLDARIGLAYVQVLRGGDEVSEAESMLHAVLADNPGEARGHFLLGLIHQQRGELDHAAARFRKAAEFLMSQRGTWVMPEENPP